MAIPIGSITIWTGALASIPANWLLCDGDGGTPNLIARFIRGAPAATEPGTTGGSDTHTHASMTAAGAHSHTLSSLNHQHTVNSAGSHSHVGGYRDHTGDTPYGMTDGGVASHNHTVNTASHSHTTSSTSNHTHTINTADGRPPFYEVAFIQAQSGANIVSGIVIIWAGTLASIPSGWALCDGGDGKPDLRERFVRGVNTDTTDPGSTGGAATHVHTEVAATAHTHTCNNCDAHYHTFNAFTWTHTHNGNYVGSPGTSGGLYQDDAHAGDHTHANSNSTGIHNHTLGVTDTHAHTVNSASSPPAYYDVAYITSVGATRVPQGGILIWTGLLANIPSNFALCDGGDTRPDLRGRFIRGSALGVNPGGTGGSDTHTHTDQNAGAHTGHTQSSAGAHQHAATDTTGAHTHATTTYYYGTDPEYQVLTGQDSRGDHSHTYGNEGAHSNHTLSNPGNHVHNPWSTDDGRPAYYEVAFIIRTLPLVVGPFPTHFVIR